MTDEYLPMMLRPGWVLERHLGWAVERDETASLKLLRRDHGFLRRRILLVWRADDVLLARLTREHALFKNTCQTVVIDFEGRGAAAWARISGRSLPEVRDGRRFGAGTFVVDLAAAQAPLWSTLGTLARRMCRRAEKAGMQVTCTLQPAPGQVAHFLALFEDMARPLGLQIPDGDVLERMFARGELMLVTCGPAKGSACAVNLIYLAGDSAFYLYGVRSDADVAGASHLAQWKGMLRLKEVGTRWYDLGQVPSCSGSDGIFRFKSSFGGRFLGYGSEYLWAPLIWRAAAGGRSLLAKAVRRTRQL